MIEPNSEDASIIMMISDHDLMTWIMIVKLIYHRYPVFWGVLFKIAVYHLQVCLQCPFDQS